MCVSINARDTLKFQIETLLLENGNVKQARGKGFSTDHLLH